MVRIKECLVCKQNFDTTYMVRGQQTNSYGDKTIDGWLCNACYSKRVQKRTKILFWGAISVLFVGILLVLIAAWFALTAIGYAQADYELVIGIYISFGGLMILFGLILFYIRRNELNKIIKLPKS